MRERSLGDAAREILRQNDRGGYTVPTDGLYPFQWNWDSGFAAMGFSTFDEARGWTELDTLFKGQWEDGMVPHIVFHKEDTRYFPGPEVWGVARVPRTSGITQPPVLAIAARYMLERAKDRELAEAAIRRLYPKLLAYHRWYHGARDPKRSGLVATFHPWETGMDNSPAWDGPLKAVPQDQLPPYQRRDLGHVAADQRPRHTDYDRYLTLVYRFRAMGYEPKRMIEESPFRVADLGINAILLRADRDLLFIGDALGTEDGKDELELWIRRGQSGLDQLWSESRQGYRSKDLATGQLIDAATAASFLPLFADAVPADRIPVLTAELERWLDQVRYGLPSTDPASPLFEARRYWRGPVWLIVNWMVADGLRLAGAIAPAERLRQDSATLAFETGLYEYYNPETGDGLGGGAFTWAAAVALIWLC